MRTIESRITPFSRDYPTCSECYVDLAIYPDRFPVENISEFLNLKATEVNIAGERFFNSLGKERTVNISSWFLTTRGDVVSKDLRDHINWIVEKLRLSSDRLIGLQNIDSVRMTLLCVWRSRFGHSGPVLWPEQMKALADLNLECSFDIYFDDPDGEGG